MILAAGGTLNFLTQDSSAAKLPSELTSFLVNEIKSMAKEAQVEIITNEYKKDVIEKAKKMNGEELLNSLKDSVFREIILNQ